MNQFAVVMLLVLGGVLVAGMHGWKGGAVAWGQPAVAVVSPPESPALSDEALSDEAVSGDASVGLEDGGEAEALDFEALHPGVMGAMGMALSASESALLDEIQRTAVRFFVEQGHPATGMVADRAPADGSGLYEVSSIAATGFGLTGLCIGQERGWLTEEEAYGRALATLRFVWEKLPHERGWFYHFVQHETGQRVWNCELSSIDTALLLAGVLSVRQYYPGTEVAELAEKIYHRVDFPWMLNDRGVFSMGWSPERGFLAATWDGYSEHLVLQILGLGSPTHPVPAETWNKWSRDPAIVDRWGRTFLACPPLFTHQFSHAFLDLRDQRDDIADYWHNSVLATRSHHQLSVEVLSEQFEHFSEDLWGITASDYAGGYTAWGGPPLTDNIDGTVVPCAAAGAIVFTPKESLRTLAYMRETYGERVWSRYGFIDAFNPQTGWYAPDVLGIDQGISLVMIENFRSGLPWRLFMSNPEIRRGVERSGLRPSETHERDADRLSSLFGAEAVPAQVVSGGWRGEPAAKVRRLAVGWDRADWKTIATANPLGLPLEGVLTPSRARFATLWDERALHLRVRVDEAVYEEPADGAPRRLVERDESFVEIYLEPVLPKVEVVEHVAPGPAVGDPLPGPRFTGPNVDLRFRFVPPDQPGESIRRRPAYDTRIVRDATGYELEASIPWSSLDVEPGQHGLLRASLSVLEGTVTGPARIKQNWRLRTSGRSIELGWLTLID